MWVYKFIYLLMMKSRWYPFWSKLYRKLFQNKYNSDNNPITTSVDFKNIEKRLNKIVYQKDTYRVLWDVCHSPYYLQSVLNDVEKFNIQPKSDFDCTSYAVLASHLLDSSFEPILMGIAYKSNNKFKFSGHMVCVFKSEDGKYCHLGNWGLHSGYESLDEIAEDISSLMESKLIGYTLFEKDISFKCKVVT